MFPQALLVPQTPSKLTIPWYAVEEHCTVVLCIGYCMLRYINYDNDCRTKPQRQDELAPVSFRPQERLSIQGETPAHRANDNSIKQEREDVVAGRRAVCLLLQIMENSFPT